MTRTEAVEAINKAEDDCTLETINHDDQSDRQQLLDCIHNLMGCFDTPISRRLINDRISNEAREIGRKILTANNISILGI